MLKITSSLNHSSEEVDFDVENYMYICFCLWNIFIYSIMYYYINTHVVSSMKSFHGELEYNAQIKILHSLQI